MASDLIEEISKNLIINIIRKFNLVESEIKYIISCYIDSKEVEFLENVLLNNMIINFSTKKKLLTYIIRDKNILSDSRVKKLNQSLNVMMNKRNLMVHSDTVFGMNTVFDFDSIDDDKYDKNADEFIKYLVSKTSFNRPSASTINDGKIEVYNVNEIHNHFIKHFKIADEILTEISIAIGELKTNS
ncbi:hypothetical protein G1K75_09370 [Tenacibaculum finnmarkense]|uniref:hypothetical protein n=1 Tax=Tenacibaculum finnmarkense TaxID=2781243 RepID=UPI001EFC1132|nr:hypothetical protein [Tenacibaculum finnmarkense]MCG8805866.1 hypothetical protein [Tenacibaculum finnmarkense]MCG8856898.1 hypothetical protein [Tenacibaculum finnmarkense]